MKEEIISLKTAKLAKEKGFSGSKFCSVGYRIDGTFTYHPELTLDGYNHEDSIYAPTQSLLAKWLREEHNLHVIPYLKNKVKLISNIVIFVNYDNGKGGVWRVCIEEINFRGHPNYLIVQSSLTPGKVPPGFISFEKAMEAGLLGALELL